ncbi:MAG TPA: carbohydrate binding domain-containing protein, partial [Pyrinomonadaceae bacterium]|nr:carbohydrate binding domain-containing protein [Pyrinomonadaceae bacterium]
LGNTREELGDREGALAAFDQAVRSAPYYAHTHWQRGNLLLRMGRYDEGFADLREAAAGNRKYFPNLLDLAWGLTGQASSAEALLQIANDDDRLAFARFLAGKGKGPDVVQQVHLLSTPLSDENKDELVRLLAESRRFDEAFELGKGNMPRGEFVNGGFEGPLVFDRDGYFRWVLIPRRDKVRLAVDVSEKVSGEKSLQIAFDGEWDPVAPFLWQTIVVEPGQQYRLKFFVKTKNLVTGGPPRIVLTDATNNRILAKSDAFPSVTEAWQEVSVDFTTPSNAVQVSLVRDNCSSSPCPIFGVVWLDDFSLQKLQVMSDDR